ncbi:hypothetical protein [Dictyobacter aurantiacus]|uniref:Uncharacterized protein n=1 Tax=Dictyobacter aurantiacus TaxID=1936993 RepID=A0A401Z8K9_9CHLR|nr:hypothetical protein [Dictyobacter aurantiacus]GCE03194.1 hypothetical protein KDAU_05230 [Dictyobacter aurantiacus]
MKTLSTDLPVGVSKKAKFEGSRFNLVFSLSTAWFLAGACLDAWAHSHLARLETFFTPWHAVLYSGFLVTALVLVITICLNRTRCSSWYEAIPSGYELTVLAVAGFAIGGVGDMLWHIFFGIERDIDAELSPTHLLLMMCGCVFLASPYRSLYHRQGGSLHGIQRLNLVLSQILLMALPILVSTGFHPLAHFWPTNTPTGDGEGQMLAVVSILFQAVVVTGFALFALQRWRLFPGFFTLTWGITAIIMAVMSDSMLSIAIAALGGVLADCAYHFLQPDPEKDLTNYRLFALLTPMCFFLAYFLVLQFATPSGVIWTIHLSAGSIVVSGLLGLLLTYLIKPPVVKNEITAR